MEDEKDAIVKDKIKPTPTNKNKKNIGNVNKSNSNVRNQKMTGRNNVLKANVSTGAHSTRMQDLNLVLSPEAAMIEQHLKDLKIVDIDTAVVNFISRFVQAIREFRHSNNAGLRLLEEELRSKLSAWTGLPESITFHVSSILEAQLLEQIFVPKELFEDLTMNRVAQTVELSFNPSHLTNEQWSQVISRCIKESADEETTHLTQVTSESAQTISEKSLTKAANSWRRPLGS
jgi:hypothetical protein